MWNPGSVMEAESVGVGAAVTHEIPAQFLGGQGLALLLKVTFGADTKSLKYMLQGSVDGTVWFNLMARDLTSATLAYLTEKTITADLAASALQVDYTLPNMRIRFDNTGSTNAATVTAVVASL
jgi:hypothetical protein